MFKMVRIFGLFVFIMVVAFSFITCDDGGGGDSSGGIISELQGTWLWERNNGTGHNIILTMSSSTSTRVESNDPGGQNGVATFTVTKITKGETVTGEDNDSWTAYIFSVAGMGSATWWLNSAKNKLADLDGLPMDGFPRVYNKVVGNNAPKTLLIRNITNAQMAEGSVFSYVFVFPAGTSEANITADITAYLSNSGSIQYAVAGMDLHETDNPVQIGSTFTIVVPLYIPEAQTGTRWTGSGAFDIYNIVSDGSKFRSYRVANISITNAITSISAASYLKIYEGNAD